ncbi:hypothetical protein ACWEQL_28870 [Kitasatospora sp. NPDC004240]
MFATDGRCILMATDEVIFYDEYDHAGKSVTLRAGELMSFSDSGLSAVRSVKVGDSATAEVWFGEVGKTSEGAMLFTSTADRTKSCPETSTLCAQDVRAMALMIRYRDAAGETSTLALSDLAGRGWSAEVPASDDHKQIERLKSEVYTPLRADLEAKGTAPAPVITAESAAAPAAGHTVSSDALTSTGSPDAPEAEPDEDDAFVVTLPAGMLNRPNGPAEMHATWSVTREGTDKTDPGHIAFSYDTRNRTVVLDRFEPQDKSLTITQDGPGMYTITRTV